MNGMVDDGVDNMMVLASAAAELFMQMQNTLLRCAHCAAHSRCPHVVLNHHQALKYTIVEEYDKSSLLCAVCLKYDTAMALI